MISEEKTLKELEKRTGLDAETLKEAFTSEDEKQIEFSDVHVFTADELELLKTNSKKVGMRENVQKFRQENGYDFTGKSLESLFDYAKSLGEADGQKEPTQKYKELEEKYKLKVDELQNASTTIDGYKNKLFNQSVSSELRNAIDIDTTIPKDDLVVLFKSKYEIEEADGVTAVKKKGAADFIKDDKLTVTPATEVFKDFANKYAKKPAGTPPGAKGEPDKDQTFRTKAEFDAWADDETDKALIDKVLAASVKKYKQEFYK